MKTPGPILAGPEVATAPPSLMPGNTLARHLVGTSAAKLFQPLVALARGLGWLSPDDQRAELMAMVGDRLSSNAVKPADVDLVCALNKDHALDQERHRLHVPAAQADKVANAAVLACLGSAEAHARVLRALSSASDDEVQIAQVYLHPHGEHMDGVDRRDALRPIPTARSRHRKIGSCSFWST